MREWVIERLGEKRDRKKRRVRKEADETGRPWKWYLFVDVSRVIGITGADVELKACFVLFFLRFLIFIYAVVSRKGTRMNGSFNRALAFVACKFRGLREATMKYTREIIALITAYRKGDIIKSTSRDCSLNCLRRRACVLKQY